MEGWEIMSNIYLSYLYSLRRTLRWQILSKDCIAEELYHHQTLENEVKVWCKIFVNIFDDSVKIPQLRIHPDVFKLTGS